MTKEIGDLYGHGSIFPPPFCIHLPWMSSLTSADQNFFCGNGVVSMSKLHCGFEVHLIFLFCYLKRKAFSMFMEALIQGHHGGKIWSYLKHSFSVKLFKFSCRECKSRSSDRPPLLAIYTELFSTVCKVYWFFHFTSLILWQCYSVPPPPLFWRSSAS